MGFEGILYYNYRILGFRVIVLFFGLKVLGFIGIMGFRVLGCRVVGLRVVGLKVLGFRDYVFFFGLGF